MSSKYLYIIAALCLALTVTLGLVLKPKSVPATSHIVEPRIPATRPATRAVNPSAPTTAPATAQTVTPHATQQPLGLATMVVGTNTNPQVLVIVITATPEARSEKQESRIENQKPTTHNPQPITPNFNTQQTSPLPTPIADATPTPIANFLPTPDPNISPLATPPVPTGAPDPATEQTVYSLLDALIAAETDYYNTHGHYAQLLISDSATCPHGETCITLDYPPGLLAGVDVYHAPGGDGYEVHINIEGWRLVVAAGPETWRAEAWHYEP